ncbi:MAG: hypothetical protein QM778_17205 [Myxococcales bacterium]
MSSIARAWSRPLGLLFFPLAFSCVSPTRELLSADDAGAGKPALDGQMMVPDEVDAGQPQGDRCKDDTDCGESALCTDGECTMCPAHSACVACKPGWTYLSRNGCLTCECGPPTQCVEDVCGSSMICVRGAICASGCERLDCCANLCAEAGCVEPAPLGCTFKCQDAACNYACNAEKCLCDTTTKEWVCYGGCADDPGAMCPPAR